MGNPLISRKSFNTRSSIKRPETGNLARKQRQLVGKSVIPNMLITSILSKNRSRVLTGKGDVRDLLHRSNTSANASQLTRPATSHQQSKQLYQRHRLNKLMKTARDGNSHTFLGSNRNGANTGIESNEFQSREEAVRTQSNEYLDTQYQSRLKNYQSAASDNE